MKEFPENVVILTNSISSFPESAVILMNSINERIPREFSISHETVSMKEFPDRVAIRKKSSQIV